MESVAVMATYPGRKTDCLVAARSIASQVDRMIIVLNEYRDVPSNFPMTGNFEYILPEQDLKDTGKFCADFNPDDYVFLCDDDIIYPTNYSSVMLKKLNLYKNARAVVGVHGVIYSDFFDGDVAARLVHTFNKTLPFDTFVNQLGTGTVVCRGNQIAPFAFMQSSQRFVDLRFAKFCAEKRMPMVCVERSDDWLIEIEAGVSIFDSYTKHWDLETVREAQSICGFRHLPAGLPTDYLIAGEFASTVYDETSKLK